MKTLFLNIFFALLTVPSFAQQNFFSKELLNCIISLEKLDSTGSLVPHGTGFIIYNYENPDEKYVITCEHVLRNPFINVKVPMTREFHEILLKEKINHVDWFNRIWNIDGTNLITSFKLIKDSTFFVNKDLDIGVFRLDIPTGIYGNKDTIYITPMTSIPNSLIKFKKDIEIGTETYFLGFPFAIGTNRGYFFRGYYSDQNSNPLLRTGTVAWKSKNSSEFLLDAFSYNGNSGSPVFTKVGVFGGEAYLIGMVFGHLKQPGVPEEVDINFGLARCVWVDDIIKLIDKLKKQQYLTK